VIEDEYLLAALRLAAGSDPAPAAVSDDARAAFALRLPGGLTADPVGLPGSTGARSTGAPHLRRYAGGGLTIDVEFALCDGRVDVAGQVSDATGARGEELSNSGSDSRVEIRTPHGREVRTPSETGHFAATGLPPGWLSIAFHRPDHAPVATRWTCVRE
jgi:hypothetical protein